MHSLMVIGLLITRIREETEREETEKEEPASRFGLPDLVECCNLDCTLDTIGDCPQIV